MRFAQALFRGRHLSRSGGRHGEKGNQGEDEACSQEDACEEVDGSNQAQDDDSQEVRRRRFGASGSEVPVNFVEYGGIRGSQTIAAGAAKAFGEMKASARRDGFFLAAGDRLGAIAEKSMLLATCI